MQEYYHWTIDQVNATIKKLHNLTLPFKKTLSFPLINIPPQRGQQTRSNTTNQKRNVPDSFLQSFPSAILFSSRVNVTIGRSPLRRGFEINLKKKKKKERKKERKTSDGTHLAHANWADFVQRRQKERERERERFVF